jgi:tetratricopeptide (TPR) repeat protein
MIIFCIVLTLHIESTIDSLKTELAREPQLNTVFALNDMYLRLGDYVSGIALLKVQENNFTLEEIPLILQAIGDDYLFAGEIVLAREEYLALVGRFPHTDIANDALERLYLIEHARKDTVLLKRLAHALCLYETERFDTARDSLRHLLKTGVGPFAYYYMALIYQEQNELALALGALEELNTAFPHHDIHNAILIRAEIYLALGKQEEARKILEELIVREPTSIYAARARQMLLSSDLE